MRKIRFAPGEYYHIFNRGTDKRSVFLDDADFDRFLQSIEDFNSTKPIGSIFENSFRKNQLGRPTSKLVDIVCYCLNKNHFHLVLKELIDGGVSEFMKRVGGYTKYFNIKYRRDGMLFQGRFKAKHIDSNEYLLRVSVYVNLNNLAHQIRGNAYRSSWIEYCSGGRRKEELCKKSIILRQFKDVTEYRTFAKEALVGILENKELTKELEQ